MCLEALTTSYAEMLWGSGVCHSVTGQKVLSTAACFCRAALKVPCMDVHMAHWLR